tara:strand:- start:413 stop:661 length:249 start_codon:yes stop_codon:yes gene_type:complete
MELPEYTQEEVNNLMDSGIDSMNVRYFIYAMVYDDSGMCDIEYVEVDEYAFLEQDGTIEYDRHTVHQNGVNQIMLTKRNDLI